MMSSLRMLPAALLTVVLASPVFAASTSENNQFRAIAALAPRKPEPPICCLQPLQPLEEKEEEVLLSFEEWKSKQSQSEKSKGKDSDNKSAQVNGGNAGGSKNGGENLTEVVNASNAEEVPIHDEMPKAQPPEVEVLSPHFRVPLRGRFNYANSDCSARVHMSHRSAKSSSAILSSKRDRYMLSPCVSPGEPHFVVVELCEDIAIDTVQLANFEFFSGVFKDFKVSVTKTDFTKPAHEWTDAGTYRAKNVRGVQSFPLPNTLRDFYRYIRIDFLSHYGSEYYCPVSLLRVYGLTHLEQWKWDEWAAQSHPETVQPVAGSLPSTPIEASSADVPSSAPQDQPMAQDQHTKGPTRAKDDIHTVADAAQSVIASTDAEPIPVAPKSTEADAPVVTSAQPKDTPPLTSAQSTRVDPTTPSAHDAHSSISDSRVYTTETAASPSITTNATPPPVNSAAASSSASPDSSSISKSLRSRSHTTSVVSSSATPIIISAGASSVSHPTTGGESIYRTIMNRITALENNHTLYALYLGEQMDGVREKLRRLGEDVGRLEGIGRGQAQAYHRTLEQWEKQQSQLQTDYRELLSKVENLSGEIVLEKRLGIAQLCLLLAVLVFMGLTRGSRERVQVAPQNNTAMWRRKFKLSGDWAHRLVRRTRSGDSAVTDATPSQRSSVDYDRPEAPPRSAEQIELQVMRNDSPSPSNFAFPDTSSPKRRPLQTSDMNSRQERHHHHVVFPVHHDHYSLKSRSRTPSRRARGHTNQANTIYSQNQAPPVTPTHHVPHTAVYSTGYARPRMQRSNSHGAPASLSLGGITSTGHRSGKRWGRVAHLHDMRGRDADRKGKRKANVERGQREGTETDEDVFGSAAAKKHSALGLYERKSRHHEGAEDARPGSSSSIDIQTPSEDGGSPTSPGKDTDGDQWVDTDTEMDLIDV